MQDTKTAPIGMGFTDRLLDEAEVSHIVRQMFETYDVRDKKVLLIVPDNTRTCPLGLMFRQIYAAIGEQTQALDVLFALGTHPLMGEDRMLERLELTGEEKQNKYAKVKLINHRWDIPGQLVSIGTISAGEIDTISGGLMHEDVPIYINRIIYDYDLLLICGPVFPHEVVGFSGGNKYLFPGISGDETIHFFHWLGAVITNPLVNGTKYTPVRAVVDRAAQAVAVDKLAFCMVVKEGQLAGLYAGEPEPAWSAAADLSSQIHVIYVDEPYNMVLSCAPPMYDELWVGGKCMYKLEPAVAEGGTLIIYAPHIHEVSYTHGKVINEIGYHVRDYFVRQWDRFKHYPRGILAHSSHVKGIGRYEDGREEPRINVVLATGIPKEEAEHINLGYLDPKSVKPEDYTGEGVLVVPKAGEYLYKLKEK